MLPHSLMVNLFSLFVFWVFVTFHMKTPIYSDEITVVTTELHVLLHFKPSFLLGGY